MSLHVSLQIVVVWIWDGHNDRIKPQSWQEYESTNSVMLLAVVFQSNEKTWALLFETLNIKIYIDPFQPYTHNKHISTVELSFLFNTDDTICIMIILFVNELGVGFVEIVNYLYKRTASIIKKS